MKPLFKLQETKMDNIVYYFSFKLNTTSRMNKFLNEKKVTTRHLLFLAKISRFYLYVRCDESNLAHSNKKNHHQSTPKKGRNYSIIHGCK